ncbi:MAG: tyrosine-type recombinase/integrase [Aestuariibacter sp.]|nr:tyrosine-type recombinase/integrase [Aestuariibacter sp.]
MTLCDAVQRYIELKQSMGSRFRSEAVILTAFYKSVGDVAVSEVKAAQVTAYLAGNGPITRFWHRKYETLSGFYRFAIGRGYTSHSPLPTTVPQPDRVFTPYIYSVCELKRLLEAVDAVDHPRAKLAPITVSALLLVLYGAALRLSEALRLTHGDVDLAACLLLIRESKFYKTRWVPIGPRLNEVLATYAREPHQGGFVQEPEATFFTTRTGEPVTVQQAERAFCRVREQAMVSRNDGGRYQPWLHDLRHTAAVHRVVAWYQQGADVQRLLPQLATYLGHVHINATQRYLTMTPALLQAANQRFEQYALLEMSND